jgi:hypothetical protein
VAASSVLGYYILFNFKGECAERSSGKPLEHDESTEYRGEKENNNFKDEAVIWQNILKR